jgi:hypothetical protein
MPQATKPSPSSKNSAGASTYSTLAAATYSGLTYLILGASGFAFALLILSGCATLGDRSKSARKNAPTGGIVAPASSVASAPAAERKLYNDLLELFNDSKWDAVLTQSAAYQRRFPKGVLTAQVENLKGLSFLMNRRPAQAIAPFRKAIELASNLQGFPHFVRYNLATAYFELGKFDESATTTGLIRLEQLDRTNRVKVHYLRSRLAMQRQNPVEAARELLASGRYLADPQASDGQASIRAALDQALARIPTPLALTKLTDEFDDSPLCDAVYLKMAQRVVGCRTSTPVSAKSARHAS